MTNTPLVFKGAHALWHPNSAVQPRWNQNTCWLVRYEVVLTVLAKLLMPRSPSIERTLLVDDVSGFRTQEEVNALEERAGSLRGGANIEWDISFPPSVHFKSDFWQILKVKFLFLFWFWVWSPAEEPERMVIGWELLQDQGTLYSTAGSDRRAAGSSLGPYSLPGRLNQRVKMVISSFLCHNHVHQTWERRLKKRWRYRWIEGLWNKERQWKNQGL